MRILTTVKYVTLVALVLLTPDGLAQEYPLPAVENMIRHAVSSENATAAWTFESGTLREDIRHLPIGVFDSGIGGLTVLDAILSLDEFNNQTLQPGSDGTPDFRNERFIYLGDQANMPYGNYASAGKEEYLRELILKDAAFLLGNRYWSSPDASAPQFDKPPVKALVIACNTATAYGLRDLRLAIREWNIPIIVVGVVEAGARGVLENQLHTDRTPGCVAVLATVGTCSSMAYPKSVAATLGLAGQRVPRIIQQGSAELAGAIEGDPAFLSQGSIDEYLRKDLTTLVQEYDKSGGGVPIDTVVLGCTHFPLITTEILNTLADIRMRSGETVGRLIAPEITIINPAVLTAKELLRSLASERLLTDPQKAPAIADRQDLFFISVPNTSAPSVRLGTDGGLDRDYKYGRQTMRLDLEDTRVVPMTAAMLPESSLNLIKTRLPQVWKRLQ